MGWWRSFLDSLDSDGGHIFVLLFLLVGAVFAVKCGISGADAILAGTFASLLTVLKVAGSNAERAQSKVTDSTVVQSSQTAAEAK